MRKFGDPEKCYNNLINEQDFDKHILEIKGELGKISKNTSSSLWKSFFSGTLSGLGSVIGVAIALAAIAWVLNTIGVIPAFKTEVNKLNQTLDQIQQNK